ncbi:MAG: redoxin domain-containing protein [Nitrospira sp.]|nr:redoxin domain-containing protein [Nitrospira sp.]
MKQTGTYALDFQGPALIGDRLTYLRGAQYADTVVALCFPPDARLISAEKIDWQAHRLQELGAALLIVCSSAYPLRRLWADQRNTLATPVLADLCGRIRRSFGVAVAEEAQRCHTFVIDRMGILRLRVNHDFI